MDDIYISKKRRNSGNYGTNPQQYPPQYPPQYPVQYPQQPPQQYYMPPPPPPPDYEPPRQPKKKKKHTFLKVVIALLSVFIAVTLVFTSGTAYLLVATSGYTRNDLDENEYISSSDLERSALVTNILLLGVDGDANSTSRSDSMILLSVDFAHAKIKLTSFLRDSWVEIPSKGKKAKLNAACTYGGPQLVVDTIEYNFGVDIDHFVMVDFKMFTQIIDNLGGVDVEVTKKEADFINRTTRQTVEHGESVNLNGAEALVYCRIRKLDSDYMRTERQRKVITALIEKAKTAGISKLIGTVYDVFPLIQTDMSPTEILGLAAKAGIGVVAFDIQQNRVPIDEHMKPSTINGQWVEVLDIEATKEYLIEFIYTNNIKFEDEE